MRDDAKATRQDQIEQAAYEVLEEKGFGGTSMLAIARRARASNETLYNWYGDKTGLFRALVARNAEEVKTLLAAQASGKDAMASLGAMGPVLLHMLTGPRAVALNRAAAADPSGTLGRAIAAEGRNTVAPLISGLLCLAREQGALRFDDAEEATDLYLGLLIGDLQIRRVSGHMPQPPAETLSRRSETALTRLQRLLG
ncbi:TetR/AcrR family transcriptional regulator [Shimia sp.]|uniref:TetR/AcrR family transcriptional regulator n=1 Tax=Shimia sp. TaxID=1954381 RepID=UPI003562EE41